MIEVDGINFLFYPNRIYAPTNPKGKTDKNHIIVAYSYFIIAINYF